jgi:hypothetical protein
MMPRKNLHEGSELFRATHLTREQSGENSAARVRVHLDMASMEERKKRQR